jgi:hypothetical protein
MLLAECSTYLVVKISFVGKNLLKNKTKKQCKSSHFEKLTSLREPGKEGADLLAKLGHKKPPILISTVKSLNGRKLVKNSDFRPKQRLSPRVFPVSPASFRLLFKFSFLNIFF